MRKLSTIEFFNRDDPVKKSKAGPARPVLANVCKPIDSTSSCICDIISIICMKANLSIERQKSVYFNEKGRIV